MSPKLKSEFQIARLAADLGLRHNGDPVAAVVKFCNKQVQAILQEFSCGTLTELLSAGAAKLDTLFVEIHDDDDLERIRRDYVAKGELAFATLGEQLGPEVFAITFKRTRPNRDDRHFVSVIDCRGNKAWRSYFSKWHELAHLLTFTQQARLKFCRTHAEPEVKDPEEALMDVIAGEVGFLPEMVRPLATGQISFERVAALRDRLCPEASHQASLIGFVRAWPTPCVLVQARLALRENERRSLSQQRLDFYDGPTPVLRAVHVTANAAAQGADILIPRNMRVPERSAIARVITQGFDSLEADEDLAWWESSSGRRLDSLAVKVKARRQRNTVDALIIPL